MKLASFHAADRDRIGVVLEGGELLDLSDTLRASGVPEGGVPRTMLELIESESITLAMVLDAVANPTAVGRFSPTEVAKSSGGGTIQNIDLNRLGGPVSVVIERIGTLSNHVVQVT